MKIRTIVAATSAALFSLGAFAAGDDKQKQSQSSGQSATSQSAQGSSSGQSAVLQQLQCVTHCGIGGGQTPAIVKRIRRDVDDAHDARPLEIEVTARRAPDASWLQVQ
jgi:hypothetical protein